MSTPPVFPGVARLRRQRLIRRAVLIAVLLVLLVVLALLWPKPRQGALAVPTTTAAPDPAGVARGALGAQRAGDRACFTVATPTGTVLLVLPPGWSASTDLALMDPAGVVAAPGEQVVATGSPTDAERVSGCPQTGRVWAVTAVALPR